MISNWGDDRIEIGNPGGGYQRGLIKRTLANLQFVEINKLHLFYTELVLLKIWELE